MTHPILYALLFTIPFDALMIWAQVRTNDLDIRLCVPVWLLLASVGALVGVWL